MRLHKLVPKKKKKYSCSKSSDFRIYNKGNRDKKQNIGEKTERESDVLFPHVNIVNNDKRIKFAGGSEWP